MATNDASSAVGNSVNSCIGDREFLSNNLLGKWPDIEIVSGPYAL